MPGGGEQFVRGHHHVDQLERLRLLRVEPLALEEHRQRLLTGRQPRHPLGAAGTGHQSDPRFGQADLHRLDIGDDAPVTGEGKLEGAADARPVDRRHHRLAAGLQPPEHPTEPVDLGVEPPQRRVAIADVRSSDGR